MKHLKTLTAALCLCGLSMPSYAQSSDYEAALQARSMEARIGVTIPFGGGRRDAQSKPQFAFGLRQETSRPNTHNWAMRPAFDESNVREFKLSLTMESNPKFLVNDQLLNFRTELAAAEDTEIDADNDKGGALDTYDKTVLTVIGVSLAVIAGSIIILSSE